MINVFDFETYNDEGVVRPYCACAIIENKEYVTYIDEGDVVLLSIQKIVEHSKHAFIEVFVHNINFDGVLLIDKVSAYKLQ